MEDPRDGGGHGGVRIVGWITLVAGIALIALKMKDGEGLSLGGAGAVLLGSVMILLPGQAKPG